MNKYSVPLLVGLISSGLLMANVAKAAQDVTPTNMTCQEFLNMKIGRAHV